MHLGKGAGAPASYTRAPGMRGGSPAAAGVAAAAFSLTPTFTPTFAGASSADLVLVLVQAVEERATARRAAEAAAAARDAAKCALQQQLDQVWPPPPSPPPPPPPSPPPLPARHPLTSSARLRAVASRVVASVVGVRAVCCVWGGCGVGRAPLPDPSPPRGCFYNYPFAGLTPALMEDAIEDWPLGWPSWRAVEAT